MGQRIEKVKAHLRENKKVYVTGATCLVVGATAGALASGKVKITTDSFKLVQWKSPTTNIITTQLARRGHPGNMVVCNETGEAFASQNRAAQALGISASNLSKHLNGEQPAVSGYTFTKLGEAA